MLGKIRNSMWAIATVGVLASSAPAQDSGGKGALAGLINVDALIDNYARFLARKYDLSEEQDAFTQKLLHEKASAFMKRHEGNLSGLVETMFAVRGGGDMSPDQLVDWGKTALPIYQEAKGIIVDGNNEWRAILTDEQRKMHDQDVKLMYDSFTNTEDQLQKIVSGEMTVEEFRNPRRAAKRPPAAQPQPQPQPVGGNPGVRVNNPGTSPRPVPADSPNANPGATPPPPTDPAAHEQQQGAAETGEMPAGAPPPQPSMANDTPKAHRTAGGSRAPASPGNPENFESEWAAYVRQFSEKYSLNDEQSQKAQAILKDCQEQASRYMQAHKTEIQDLNKQATDGTADPKQRAGITQQKGKLLEPVTQIFEKSLKPRLEKLPTRSQRREADAGGAKSAPKPAPAAPAKPAPKDK
ncbi:hypothetical protein RAS1_16560 [Phycisphaerae bacterium RAS1]|nr:hypothetical protein RAS1_16560 [Phycisphaerae bacterium RAS1]